MYRLAQDNTCTILSIDVTNKRCYLCGMRLKQYLDERYLKAGIVSKKLGVNPSTVTKWLSGQSIPRPFHAALIAKMTNGRVGVADFHDHYQEVHSGHPVEAEG